MSVTGQNKTLLGEVTVTVDGEKIQQILKHRKM